MINSRITDIVIITTILGFFPIFVSSFPIILTLLIIALNFAIVASNWNLLYGYGGVWSLGQLGFFAIGAYSSALLTKFYGASPWIAILIGVGISTLATLAISLITIRLGTLIYFALATLGFHMVVRGFIVMIYPGAIFDIPHMQLGDFSFVSYGDIGYYYVFLLLFLLSLTVHRRILRSKIGLVATALRDNEILALSLGVEPTKTRVFLFLISAIFTSVAGSIYAYYTNSVSQSILGLDPFLTYFILLAFGGIGTFYGPTMASFIWVFLDFLLRLYIAKWRLIVMGGIVVLSLLFLKRGIAGLLLARGES